VPAAVRPARLDEVPGIHALLVAPAAEGLLLPRTLPELYENLRDFVVVEGSAGLTGCAALHVYGPEMGEIKSLAVAPKARREGLGRALVEACVAEAARIGLARVFTLTYQRDFFQACGFHPVDRSRLPEKVWGECVRCRHFLACDEVSLWRRVAEIDASSV